MVDDSRTFWDSVASEIGVPVAGLEFVYEALAYAPQYSGEEPGDVGSQSRHCTAQEFCHAFVCFAKDAFGGDYVDALVLWGLDTSEKLGCVVYDLIGRNLLDQQVGDRQSDFDGQFDLTKSIP